MYILCVCARACAHIYIYTSAMCTHTHTQNKDNITTKYLISRFYMDMNQDFSCIPNFANYQIFLVCIVHSRLAHTGKGIRIDFLDRDSPTILQSLSLLVLNILSCHHKKT